MPDHILDISQEPCRISMDGPLLVLRRNDQPEFRMRMDEIAALCVSEPATTASMRTLGALSSAGVLVVVCDERRQPSGMLMPLAAHHAQTPRFAMQAQMSRPTRKRLWRQLVRGKVRHQAAVLVEQLGADCGLESMVAQVLPGDPTNIEAQAAAIYWPRLMGEAFRRDPDLPGANSLFNYGYAVLRAVVCRAICGAGLHPTLGVNHHHRENAFCLADDVMEPLRPLVDRVVISAVTAGEIELTTPVKQRLIGAVMGRHRVKEEDRTLFDIARRMAQSMVQVVMGERRLMAVPRLQFNAAPR